MEYMKKVIKELANSIPKQAKVNMDAKHNFDKENEELIRAFAEIGIILKDKNGDYCYIYDASKDMNKKHEY